MIRNLHFLLSIMLPFCSGTWAVVEITGANTFTYTDNAGDTTTRQIRGYTKPENVDHYLQSAISSSTAVLRIDKDLDERKVSKIYVIQFSADQNGFIDQTENIGFIVILNDGTTLLSFDYLSSPAPVVSTYDQTTSHDGLMSHLINHGEYIGEASGGSFGSLGLWSTSSSMNEKLKQLGFRRNKKKTDRYQATFLVPNIILSGQGTLDIKKLGIYQYTILEST